MIIAVIVLAWVNLALVALAVILGKAVRSNTPPF